MRAWLAVRFSDLVGGAGAAVWKASRDRGQPAAFFPEHWDGLSDTYSIAQHVDDVIGFIEKLETGPVDLMGHSRGGHISFRVAQRRPDLLRKLILAEPGGELDATLDPEFKPGPSPLAARIAASAEVIASGRYRRRAADFHGRAGRSRRLEAAAGDAEAIAARQRHHADRPDPRPAPAVLQADAEAIRTPTLFIGGANTKGALPQVLRTLAAHVKGSRTEMIPGTTHPMFEQAPQKYCEIVLDFLAGA